MLVCFTCVVEEVPVMDGTVVVPIPVPVWIACVPVMVPVMFAGLDDNSKLTALSAGGVYACSVKFIALSAGGVYAMLCVHYVGFTFIGIKGLPTTGLHEHG